MSDWMGSGLAEVGAGSHWQRGSSSGGFGGRCSGGRCSNDSCGGRSSSSAQPAADLAPYGCCAPSVPLQRDFVSRRGEAAAARKPRLPSAAAAAAANSSYAVVETTPAVAGSAAGAATAGEERRPLEVR